MPYGYLGQNTPNQTVSNSGVFSISDVASLEKQGKFGGSLELIEEQVITTQTSAVDFTNIKGTEYDVHILQASNIRNATDDQQFAIRMSVGGTFDTANNYQRAIFTIVGSGGSGESRDTAINNIFFTLNQGNATNEKGNGYAYFYNLHNSSKYSFVTLQTTTINVNGEYKMNFGGGVYNQTASVDGIRIFMSNGSNIASGVFRLYGVKQL